MAADLAHDRGDGVRGQRGAASGVVAVDRLDQADRSDLREILELLAASCEAARERPDEREVLLDQLLAGFRVTIVAPGPQEILRGGRHGSTLVFE